MAKVDNNFFLILITVSKFKGDLLQIVRNFEVNETEHDLKVTVGDIVKYIAIVDEAEDWFLAKFKNEEGFVPFSVVEKCQKVTQIKNQEIPICKASEERIKELLRFTNDGCFILAECDDDSKALNEEDEDEWNNDNDILKTNNQDLYLYLNIEYGVIKRYKILNRNGKYKFDLGGMDGTLFDDLKSFIQFYKSYDNFEQFKDFLPSPLGTIYHNFSVLLK